MYVTEKISPVFRPVFLKNPGSPESTAFQAYPGISSMPLAGLEPARGEPLDFESSASANSATAANKAARADVPLSLAD